MARSSLRRVSFGARIRFAIIASYALDGPVIVYRYDAPLEGSQVIQDSKRFNGSAKEELGTVENCDDAWICALAKRQGRNLEHDFVVLASGKRIKIRTCLRSECTHQHSVLCPDGNTNYEACYSA